MKYVLVSPIGPQKHYCCDFFWAEIDKWEVPPETIYLYGKTVVKEQYLGHPSAAKYDVVWMMEDESIIPRFIPATTMARETLRRAALEGSPECEWFLLVDPDLMPIRSDHVQVFNHYKYDELVVLLSWHPSRYPKGSIRRGTSFMWTHRDLLEGVPFTMATVRGQSTGDDLIWRAIVRQLCVKDGIEGKFGFYFETKHIADDGEVQFFNEEDSDRWVFK